MKFTKKGLRFSEETVIDKENYSVEMTVTVECIGFPIPEFEYTITVVSNNSQTGAEVDVQRELVADKYIDSINEK